MNLRLLPDTDPLLRERMPSYTGNYKDIQALLPELYRMMTANNGIGLAAPQVGLKMNFFIMKAGNKHQCVVNPVIVEYSKSTCIFPEGCLSFPKKKIYISRPVQITVAYENEQGEFITELLDGIASRCFQHEYDHLVGKLFTAYEQKNVQ